MWFEAISGLKVNFDKSELIPTEIVDYADDLAREFGCKLGSLPSTYPGLPLGAPFRHVAVWDGVEKRLQKIDIVEKVVLIQGWETLLRSTLSSIPIYFMSLFGIPRAVRLRLEQIQRNFMWGGGASERKPHLVRWSIICASKGQSGLRSKRFEDSQ